jgi:hypothetical protein
MQTTWWRGTVVGLGLAGLAVGLTGCIFTSFPVSELEIPPELQFVLDNPAQFISPADDPMETVAPGTVIDDLAELDGCWGLMLTEGEEVEMHLALVAVYRFDRATGRYSAWTTIGREAGGIWPTMPVISLEEGTFEVAGPALLRLKTEKSYANVDPVTGQLTRDLREQPIDSDNPAWEQSGLATLDGDRLLFFLGDETAADVDLTEERPIHYRFACP